MRLRIKIPSPLLLTLRFLRFLLPKIFNKTYLRKTINSPEGREILMVDQLPQGAYQYLNGATTTSDNSTRPNTYPGYSYTVHVDYPFDSITGGTATNANNDDFNTAFLNPALFSPYSALFFRSSPVYIKEKYDKEEKALNDYLIKNQELKEEKMIEEKRRNVNPISQLQLEE